VRTRRTESAQTDPESPEHTLGAVDNVAEAPFKAKSNTHEIQLRNRSPIGWIDGDETTGLKYMVQGKTHWLVVRSFPLSPDCGEATTYPKRTSDVCVSG
jgi:hypothetical protein